ncbi:hypothetical protein TRIUR3_04735 [Triticum urartu]|uniref:Uncharacterized protein n=1 Tax=Triticum urartu TaxID=4572 RepID=M7Z3J3_TRIUA|nr:hypothetical protein TRIUR3_04735 [Triticum urartu]
MAASPPGKATEDGEGGTRVAACEEDGTPGSSIGKKKEAGPLVATTTKGSTKEVVVGAAAAVASGMSDRFWGVALLVGQQELKAQAEFKVWLEEWEW